MNTAVVGLGKMGVEIAGTLLRSGHAVAVYNRTAGKAQRLADLGARVAATPREAAAGADVVLTMVLDDAGFEEVTFGPDGILEGLPESAVHAGLSTISVALAKRLADAHTQRGRAYVGAPVLGRPEAARDAKLIVMVGGDAAAIAKLQPVLDAIGRTTFPAGAQPWQANLFKLCSNFMIASMLETFGESQALVRKAGSSPAEFVALMAEFWGSPIYRNYGTLISQRKYDPPGATLTMGLKDNRLLLEAARDLTVPLPTASLIRDQMLAAIAAGNAELDWASVSDTAIRNAGLTIDEGSGR